MKQIKIHYTPQNILNKSFPLQHKGYNPLKVDTFLDMVIRDYKTFYKVTHQLYTKIKDLENDQSGMYVTLQHHLNRRKQQNEQLMKYNSDLLKKMSQREHLESIIIGAREPTDKDWQFLDNRLSKLESEIYNS